MFNTDNHKKTSNQFEPIICIQYKIKFFINRLFFIFTDPIFQTANNVFGVVKCTYRAIVVSKFIGKVNKVQIVVNFFKK